MIQFGFGPLDICLLSRIRPDLYLTESLAELARRNIYARFEEQYQDLMRDD